VQYLEYDVGGQRFAQPVPSVTVEGWRALGGMSDVGRAVVLTWSRVSLAVHCAPSLLV
jgi:hypothetical protein